MKFYVKQSSPLYKFLPKSGRTDYNSLKFAFASLAKGDYLIDNDGAIYRVLDPGQLYPGFLESYRTIEVEEVELDKIPDRIKDAIHYLANSYPSSSICRKVLQQG